MVRWTPDPLRRLSVDLVSWPVHQAKSEVMSAIR